MPGHPYHPYAADHAPTEFGTLAAADGQTLHYALMRPRNLEPGRRYPVIVDVYGGPAFQNVTDRWAGTLDLFYQLLARDGYLVFTLDNRGSGERGVRFEAALLPEPRLRRGRGPGRRRALPAHACPTSIRRRIGIFGWSYGGYMALMCADAGAGELCRRRRRRAGHRLAAVRHALHRALHVDAGS